LEGKEKKKKKIRDKRRAPKAAKVSSSSLASVKDRDSEDRAIITLFYVVLGNTH